jgi:hypothetical protein
MIAIAGLAYTKVARVPLGHLILCPGYSGAAHELALRVQVPDENGMDNDGVLLLRSDTHWGDIGAVVHRQFGDQTCLDLGLPLFAIDGDSVAAAISRRPYDARPGALAVCDQEMFILAAFDRFRHQHAWWHVTSGEPRKCEERLVLERWCVGLRGLDKKFIPQLRYPEDFKRDAPAS